MNEVVVGAKFIPANTLYDDWNKWTDFEDLSKGLGAGTLSLGLTDVIALKSIEIGFKGAAGASGLKSFSQAKALLNDAEVVGNISRFGVGGAVIGLSVIEGLSNPDGWQKHNTIDVVVGAVSMACPLFGLVYGVLDIGSKVFTNKTISEHIEDYIEK